MVRSDGHNVWLENVSKNLDSLFPGLWSQTVGPVAMQCFGFVLPSLFVLSINNHILWYAKDIGTHSKMKISWKCIHPQAIQDPQIWINLALHHFITNRSSVVHGCRQNESPDSLYKHNSNPHVIHLSPVHMPASCEMKSYIMFVIKKPILKNIVINFSPSCCSKP